MDNHPYVSEVCELRQHADLVSKLSPRVFRLTNQRDTLFYKPSVFRSMPKKIGRRTIVEKSLKLPLVPPLACDKSMHEEEPLLLSSSPQMKRRRSRPLFYSGRGDIRRTKHSPPPPPPPQAEIGVVARLDQHPPPTVESAVKCEEGVLVDLSFWPEPQPEITESVLKGDIEILRRQFAAVLQHSRDHFQREVLQQIKIDREVFEDQLRTKRAEFEIRLAKDRAEQARVGAAKKEAYEKTLKVCKSSSDLVSQDIPRKQMTDVPPRRHQSEIMQGPFEGLTKFVEEVNTEMPLLTF